MAYQFKNITVLMVDSQPAVANLVQGVLKIFGVKNTIICNNAHTGLQAFRKERPDLVIVDWHIGSSNGIDFTKAVRSDPDYPYTPIIFTTALSSEKRVATARDSGITEFLRKPFTARALYKRIEFVVEKPRSFVQSHDFFGPDRRRKYDQFAGNDRREKWVIDLV